MGLHVEPAIHYWDENGLKSFRISDEFSEIESVGQKFLEMEMFSQKRKHIWCQCQGYGIPSIHRFMEYINTIYPIV